MREDDVERLQRERALTPEQDHPREPRRWTEYRIWLGTGKRRGHGRWNVYEEGLSSVDLNHGAVETRECVELAPIVEALRDLTTAARPYVDNAAPHEQLFSGVDLRNFELLNAKLTRAEALLASLSEQESPDG